MKTEIDYIIRKSLFHIVWLKWLMVVYYFIFNRYFRSQILLIMACNRVESQDECRVWYQQTIKPIADMLNDLTIFLTALNQKTK
jgi:hypothetical protein